MNGELVVFHSFGFFSCCTVRLQMIIKWYNEHKKLPIVDSSHQWSHYKDKEGDVSNRFFNTSPTINAYTHHIDFSADTAEDQFSDYSRINFSNVSLFIEKYYAPSDEVLCLEQKLVEKYKIDVNNTVAVCFRGTDKRGEVQIPTYSKVFEQVRRVQHTHGMINSKVLIQSDEQEFIEAAKLEFPNHIHLEENPMVPAYKGGLLPILEHIPEGKKVHQAQLFLATVLLLSKCSKVVLQSGNVGMWICLFRNSAEGVYQYRGIPTMSVAPTVGTREKINIIGDSLSGEACSTAGKVSKYIEWVTDGSAKVAVHVDDGLFQSSSSDRKLGWLLESQAIRPQLYTDAPQVLDNFECIFTHSKELLDLDPRFKFAPVGTHWIKEPSISKKTKSISMIASNFVLCQGHQLRQEWIQRLRDKVAFFGKGFNYIKTKEEGLTDYMFSIVIENCSVPNYFTEKIGDCFATGTIPVYIGCSNIDKFFNSDGIIQLSHELNLESLTEELYLSKLDAVKDNFERIKKYEISEDWMYETYQGYFKSAKSPKVGTLSKRP